MTHLVVGQGLVGSAVYKSLLDSGESVKNSSRSKGADYTCDVLEDYQILKMLDDAKPSVVINAANLAGGVNFCEENRDLAEAFHYRSHTVFGKWCRENKSRYVLVSTDYVFDGERPPYSEGDRKNPLNVYGEMKSKAEDWIVKGLTDYLIVRTTNVYGWDPDTKTPNFLMGNYRKLIDGQEVSGATYSYGTPTQVDDLANAIAFLCARDKGEVYHIVGPDHVNRYEWLEELVKQAGFDAKLLSRDSTPQKGGVRRPKDARLDTAKYEGLVGAPKLRGLKSGVEQFVADLKRL